MFNGRILRPLTLSYMLVSVTGAKCLGLDAHQVTVEVDICSGVGIHLVGLADTAVKESLLRIVTALQALGFHVPGRKIVINLAPADMLKKGGGYDLPIAVGIIAASEQRSLPLVGDFLIMGELGLDGSVRDIRGAISFAEMARERGMKGCILPVGSALETVQVDGIPVYGVSSLEEALKVLEGVPCDGMLARGRLAQAAFETGEKEPDYMDFSEIIGQQSAKRGIEIAAAGGHNVIMIGPPGSGKSSLAKACAGILPPMSKEESLVTTKIYSVAGRGVPRGGLITRRPVRAPHYSVSLPAMIGGGSGDNIMPGEVSLAHNGILFLDEFNQSPKSVIEALRGPLEDRRVTVSRLKSRVAYPSSFMLVAAANPCPCGYWGEGDRCTCTVAQRQNYLSRLSGPILDRIDIQLPVRSLSAAELLGRGEGRKRETSAQVAARVAMAREIQKRRFDGTGIFCNAEMNSRQLDIFCPLSEDCRIMMEKLIDRLGLSARAYTRIIKVARTIADLSAAVMGDGVESVHNAPALMPEHIAEAAGYRFLDRRDLDGISAPV